MIWDYKYWYLLYSWSNFEKFEFEQNNNCHILRREYVHPCDCIADDISPYIIRINNTLMHIRLSLGVHLGKVQVQHKRYPHTLG
jgi:hypothetical protein